MQQNDRFSTRWGLILAALGMAIGTGNIWRFPRIVANSGGGTFLVPWLIFLATWSVPLLIVESAMGKTARRGTVGAFLELVGARSTWRGAFVGFCAMAIGFYYSVVAGWCIKYFLMSLSGDLLNRPAQEVWEGLASGRGQQVLFHFVALSLATFVIVRGVSGGIEKVNRVLIPALFAILVMAAIRAVTLPGATEGLAFLFTFRAAELADYEIWLAGLSQSAWSTGAGAGLILTYAAYARRDQNIVFSSVMTGLGNNAASLLAAIAVIPTVFSLMPTEEALATISTPGPASTGMTFITMPELLQRIAGGPTFFLPLFFLAISFAAISSMIAVLELGVRNFVDFGMSRKRAVGIVFVSTFLLGLPSALSSSFFSNQDWVWGLGLSISGFFIATAARRIGARRLIDEWINTAPGWKVGPVFGFVVLWLIPIQLFVLLGWWLYQSIVAADPDGWWNPFRPNSFGTAVFQWGVALIIFFLLNAKLNRLQESGQ
ncbi:MAG: sodium-dependent transporter [Planctomycetota bacterium]